MACLAPLGDRSVPQCLEQFRGLERGIHDRFRGNEWRQRSTHYRHSHPHVFVFVVSDLLNMNLAVFNRV